MPVRNLYIIPCTYIKTMHKKNILPTYIMREDGNRNSNYRMLPKFYNKSSGGGGGVLQNKIGTHIHTLLV